MSQFQVKRDSFINKVNEGQSFDLVLITEPKSVYYLTGFFTDPHERFMGLFWDKQNGWSLILPKLDKHAAQSVIDPSISVIGHGDDENAQDVVTNYFKTSAPTVIGIEANILSYERANWLLGLNERVQLHNISFFMNDIRLIKTPEEIELLAHAGKLTDVILQQALTRFQKGMKETDLVAEIEYQAKKEGAEAMAFSTTVLAGPKSALPHGNSADKTINDGLLLIDFGIVKNGYCSDMTRTFHVGEWEEKPLLWYETVLKAEQTAIQKARVGMTFEELDAIARAIITETGFGDFFIHRLGHGMGLEVHEYPSVGAGNKETIKEGMVFTIEPGIYVPNEGGIRIEDAVVMTKDGAQTLTSYPKQVKDVVL